MVAEAPSWGQRSSHFEADGSLRDIYVLDADLEVWQRVIDALVASEFELAFSIDGVAAELHSVAEIMVKRQDVAPLLRISLGLATVNCHFFDEAQIEFDITPKDITDRPSLYVLLAFMRVVSEASDRPVRLTHENTPNALICEARPSSAINHENPAWFVWPIAIQLRAEYGSGPLWCKHEPYYLDTRYVPIPIELALELETWQRAWDETLAPYPPDSSFATAADETDFWAEGDRLAKQLEAATPYWVQVDFKSSQSSSPTEQPPDTDNQGSVPSCGQRLIALCIAAVFAIAGIVVAATGYESRPNRSNRPFGPGPKLVDPERASLGFAIFWASAAAWSFYGLRGFYNAVRDGETQIWRHPGRVLSVPLGLFVSYKFVVEIVNMVSA